MVLTSPCPSATSRLRGTARAPARRADHPSVLRCFLRLVGLQSKTPAGIRLVAVLAHDLKVQKMLCGVEAIAVDARVTEEVTQALHRHSYVWILQWCNCMLAHIQDPGELLRRHPFHTGVRDSPYGTGPAWVRLRVSFPSFFSFFFFLPLPFLFFFPYFYARCDLEKGSNKAEQKSLPGLSQNMLILPKRALRARRLFYPVKPL